MNIRLLSLLLFNTTLALAIQQEPLDALGHQAQLEMAITALEHAPRPAGVRQHIWEDVVLFGLQMDPTFLSLFNHGITAGEISAIINALPPIIRAEITRFDISSNQLTQLPPAIGLLTSLTVFSAHDNQFTELPAAMSNLTQLHTFNVSHNNFDHTPAVLAHLPALHNLDVSANRLTRISVGVMQLPNLQTIFVNDGVDVPEYLNPDITIVRIADDE